MNIITEQLTVKCVKSNFNKDLGIEL